MTSIYHYNSPLGGITLSSSGSELTGLWFDGTEIFWRDASKALH